MIRTIAFLAISAIYSVCSADDSSPGVPLPQLTWAVGAGSLRVTAVSIKLADDNLHVESTLARGSKGRERGQLQMAWPRYGWLGEGEPYPVRHSPELRMTIDRLPAVLHESVDAYMGDRRITPLLEAGHLDPWAITETPPLLPANTASTETLQALEHIGAVSHDDGQWLAAWSAQRQISFAIPSNAAVLAIDVKAMPGFELLEEGRLPPAALMRDACIAPKQTRAALRGRQWVAKSYLIPVGFNGRGPSEAQVQVSTPGALVAACAAPGVLTRMPISATATPVRVAVTKDATVRLLVLIPAE